MSSHGSTVVDHANGHNGVNGAEKANGHYNNGNYGNGASVNRALTPGGNPVDTTQPAFPVYHRKFANPAPLGLMAFATTTLILSLFNVGARNITIPNLILSMAFGYGGLVQLLAGMWEFAAGNTFGATAFSSYGGFWISFGLIYWPGSGILNAYQGQSAMEASALGIYLASWFTVTFIFLIAAMRSSLALVSVFFFLTITFLLLFAGELCTSVGNSMGAKLHIAGGAFGIVTALCAYYTALAGLLTPESSHFIVPVGDLSRKRRD